MHAKYSLVHARMTLFSDKISYGKNNLFYVFYAFDTESIQEVDNFQINIDVFTNQTECLNTIQQDLLPISLLIPEYSQSFSLDGFI